MKQCAKILGGQGGRVALKRCPEDGTKRVEYSNGVRKWFCAAHAVEEEANAGKRMVNARKLVRRIPMPGMVALRELAQSMVQQ